MKLNFKHIIYILLVLISTCVHAQQNLQFVENKGQWSKNIQFKGEMVAGAFALKPDGGYRMLQYDTTSLKQILEKLHPHHITSIKTPAQNKGKTAIGLLTSNQSATLSNSDVPLKGHVYEVKFLNANPNPVAIPDKPLATYNNYFIGNDPSKWAGNCKIYTAVTYKNVYPNIDVRYYTDKGNLKYDFIVNPGGDANNIIMYVDGADNVSLRRGQLAIKTSVGEVKENIPSSFQFDKVKGKRDVGCNYKVTGNIVHFNIQEEVDKNSILIIDPQFVFSTFTGSRADNWGFTATYDAGGNFYAGGIVFNTGFPISNGAYQGYSSEENQGYSVNIGIMKFNPLGTEALYATYLGGNANDFPHSLVVDNNGNLIVAGKTTSSNYPATQPHLGPGTPNENNYDIILTKLNSTGTGLIGSRVIGGKQNDGVNINVDEIDDRLVSPSGPVSTRRNYGDAARSEVIVDSTGNIYLASCTQSDSFPTVNALQPTHGANTSGTNRFNQDAVIIKTSPDLSKILFSTFLGGNGDDGAFILALDPTSNILAVAGATVSTDFPGVSTNVINSSFQGGACDGFIVLMDSAGKGIIHSSYLGTKGDDAIFGVQYDKLGYPYILGTTTGSWPVVNANFSQAGAKQFIAKLQKDLSGFVYSTTFGTRNATVPNISPTAFLVDRCENVYVSGWGFTPGQASQYFTNKGYQSTGTKGLSITNDAIKSKTDGNDFYFFVLKRDALDQLYGSYFGQTGGFPNHVDGGTSRFDKNGVIYQSVCANCGGYVEFPTTAGAAYPANGSGGGCNLAAIKIAFNLSGVGASIRSTIKGIQNKVVGCVPLSVSFTDVLGEGSKYIWSFGDGSPNDTTTVNYDTSHIYKSVGSYYATVVSIDSTTCNISDTSGVVMRVASNEATINFTANKTGDCTSTTYLFDNQSTAPSKFKPNSFTLYFGDGSDTTIGAIDSFKHTYPPQGGTYIASLWLTDTSYCNAPDSTQKILRIAQNVKAIINTDSVGCSPYTAIIQNASQAGQTFNWSFGDGTTYSSPDLTITHYYPDTGTYIIKLEAIDNSTCNKSDETSFTLVTKPKPTAAFTYTPNPPQANQPVNFINQSSNANEYLWLFADGDSLMTSSTQDVSHIFNTSQIFRVNLIATNESGCADTAIKDIHAVVASLLDVANAIAPNGANKTIQVRGYGIQLMNWVIYNRWGQVVFQTTNRNDAWDGRCNGQLQPADVYTYTLNVTFTDGTQTNKTGDITLLK